MIRNEGKYLKYYCGRLGIPIEDALQEYEAWKLEGKQVTLSRVLAILWQRYARPSYVMSLNDGGQKERDWYEAIPAPEYEDDTTYPNVIKALGRWVKDGTITITQGEAILLYAVDGWYYTEIGKKYEMHHTTVMYHYKRGIERLRERYASTG